MIGATNTFANGAFGPLTNYGNQENYLIAGATAAYTFNLITGRITANAPAWFLFTGQVNYAGAGVNANNGEVQLRIRKNGVTILGMARERTDNSFSGESDSIVGIDRAVNTDYYELVIVNNSTGTISASISRFGMLQLF
jgi:hypothetical protein